MKQLYLDCQYGISGDMTLSALIDLGADLAYITEHLKKLPIDPFSISVKRVDKRGISSNLLDLQFSAAELVMAGVNTDAGHHHDHEEEGHSHHHAHSHQGHSHSQDHSSLSHGHSDSHEHSHDHLHTHHHHHEHRKASTILEMIRTSELPARVKDRSQRVFEVIAEAEGKIHGMDPKEVHFHEVGAMDSIIDIIGVCLALESLEIDRITASPVPTGHGKVKMAHGLYPIPAPATAEILRGVPLEDFHVRGELTTPTGAGFLKALADDYGYMPARAIDRIGYGAGQKDFEHPNVLRAILFE
ncbi:LarC family nickel insertion protein [Fictibacillus sp. NRS-1165]|uniref:LarC family nickel insertion protein n=1 Tax=Fictibacillus sp. NRS-1165 TaxID=3144463 RepID=UPI003D202BBF